MTFRSSAFAVPSPESGGEWIANNVNPAYHLRRFSVTAAPVVVLVGDSTATPFANALDTPATLTGMLEKELRRQNPHKTITFYNRAIGGTKWTELNTGPGGTAPYDVPNQVVHWYTNANTDWLDYVSALAPDLVIIQLGTNDERYFSPPSFLAALAKINAFTKRPDILFCTNLKVQPVDPSGVFSAAAAQNGRDIAAGMTRTYARYAGYGLLDFNRAYNILVEGLDPASNSLEEILTAQSVTVNPVYAVTSSTTRDYAFTATFADIPADFWGDVPGGAVAPFKVRLSGYLSPAPNASEHNDLLVWKDAGGNLFYNVRLRRETGGTDTFLFSSDQDSGVAAPVAGTVRLNVQVSNSLVRLSLRGDWLTDFSETIVINRSLARFGGVFLPAFGYDGATGDRPSTATLTLQIGQEKRSMPIVSSKSMWGSSLYPNVNTQQPYGGNGVNHPASVGANQVYGWVLENTNLFGSGVVSSTSGNVGIGKRDPLGTVHIASGESGVSPIASKGTTSVLEGVNGAGQTILTSTIGTAYIAVIGDPDNNEKAWVEYNHNLDAYTFTIDGVPVARIGSKRVQTYSASITLDARRSDWYEITATNGTAFAMNAPSNASGTQKITITIRNDSGGALGVITWDAVFKMAAWTSPATGFSRSIDFRFDGTNWIEIARSGADVPN